MKFVKTGSIAFFGLVILIVNVAYAGFWQVENSSARPGAWIDTARHFSSDDDALRRFLDQVPVQHSGQSLQIELPMPDGSNGIFEIFESSIMAEELAAKYPQIKSYKVRGVDDPGASGRVDISPAGFRGMIFTSQGLVFIDPESGSSSSSSQRYKSRRVEGMGAGKGFSCASGDANLPNSVLTSNKISNRTEGGLLKFDLALSATREFVIAIYGSDLSDVSAARAAALAEMNTAITRVNEIFERDFGITLELISENDELIEVTDTGAFTNGNANLMLSENQTWVDGRIASSSYDIGHVLGAGRNGIAFTRVVCNDPNKAMGVTGYSGSSNDSFYLDFLAHELAHQFGANHSFNGTSGSCFSNRDPGTAYEPGSGTTIMSYAGSCGAEAIQFDGDATFHAGSIAEVNSFVSGISCFDINSYGNNDPTANAGANHNIPVDTAFVLEGSGVDVDGNTLSYQWDQMDAGRATTSGSLGDDFGDNALFRSYVPQDSPGRHFPALGTQLDNLSDWSEALPCTERELNFRLTVRDGTSGQATDDVVLSVDDSSGPFQITSHNSGGTIYTNSGRVTLQWDVANTDNAIVNCTAVDIDLLTFASDHSTYAVNPLVRGTINDGLASVSIPNQSSTQARFRVSCSNNIFYDISDHDLTIRGSGALVYFNTKGNDTFYNED
ncbi:MAG: hypothetical protein GY784_07255, partial [Gammaproteobacteria bacterium]|nr:hypothetical protein [Gammaproteobacteria bacterium]